VTNGVDTLPVPQVMMSAWMNIAAGGGGVEPGLATLEFVCETSQLVGLRAIGVRLAEP
jgi:hypothetical protein